ncbi:MAG: SGNH/GDSL hydrolase family protein [Caulobacteraceae bacterium]
MAFPIKRMWALAAVAALALTGSASSQPASSGWVGVWGASPLPPTLVASGFATVSPSFDNQTVRQVVRVNGGGSQVRLRLTNEYGSKPLEIGEVHVALSAGPGGAIVPGSDHVVTFSGAKSALIPAEAPMLSDPIAMDVKPLTSLAVSIYFPADTGPCTCHQLAVQTGFVSDRGDFAGATAFPAKSTFISRAFLSGVEAMAPAKTIVAFGDSITDGAVSTNDANHRWPDRLAERLNAAAPGKWGVVNQGISGNQLLADGAGQSGPARFDRDVLSVSGVSHVIVLLGVNDLGIGYGPPRPGARPNPNPPSFEAMQAAYRQLIARAHARGVKIYGGTITPYEGASYWSPAGEAVRERINAWILTSKEWDGVVDFAAAWADPAKPSVMKEGVGAADHLHGSDAGYAAMGDAVPLDLFR